MSNEDIGALRSKLSAAQLALLEKRISDARADLPHDQTIPRRPVQESAPLSFQQQWLWFLIDRWRHGGTSPVYIMPAAIRLRGRLKVAALERALNEIVRRHEALRTSFAAAGETRVQIIAPSLTLPLPVIDLSSLPEARREDEALRLAKEEAGRLFDLSRVPLLRTTLLRLGSAEYVVLLTMHHIISDGWSMGVFMQEVAALYEAFSNGKPSPLPELPIQYPDFAVWQQDRLNAEALEPHLAYWKRKLAGAPPVLDLPTDRPRPPIQTSSGARQSRPLSRILAEGLKRLSLDEHVTLPMTFLAAFNVLLQRCVGRDDILVGTHVANRTRVGVERLIGYFINNLVLRTDLSGDPTVRELLGRVRAMMLEAFTHQEMPFLKLLEALAPPHDLSRPQLVQVFFVFENTPMPALDFAGLSLSYMKTGGSTATRELFLVVTEGPEGLTTILVYKADLFEDATISRMMENLHAILESFVADPLQRLSALSAAR